MLSGFQAACYRVELQAGERGLTLPPYKGSTLRGGFGTAFRLIACAQKHADCKTCLLQSGCPYAYVFETAPPHGSQALSKYENVPRPFVLEPQLDQKTDYRPGETLEFGLVLVGKSIQYLPYFILAFRELGGIGIGRGRSPYCLKRIVAYHPLTGQEEEIYREDTQKVFNRELLVTGEDICQVACELDRETLSLTFLTMMRLYYGGQLVPQVEFHQLMRALLRRISALYYFHHQQEWQIEITPLINQARE